MSTFRYLMQAQDTNLGQTVRWGATDPDFRALQYSSTSDIDLNTVEIIKKFEPMGGGSANRRFGLTSNEQNDMVAGYRPSSASTKDPPLQTLSPSSQTDGQNIVRWFDLSDHYADFDQFAQIPEWDQSENAALFDRSNQEGLFRNDNPYWDVLHQGTVTISCQIKLNSSVGLSNFYTVFDTSDIGSGGGIRLRVNDNQHLQYDLYDGGTQVANTVSTSALDDGNWHDVTIVQDMSSPQTDLYIDDTLENQTSGYTIPSSPSGSILLGAGFDSGSPTQPFDGWIRSFSAYRGTGVRSNLKAWNRGRVFTTSPPVVQESEVIHSLAQLPSSPRHGDQVLLQRNSTEVDLRYDSGEGDWVIAGTPVTNSDGYAELWGGEYEPEVVDSGGDPTINTGSALEWIGSSDADQTNDETTYRLPVLGKGNLRVRSTFEIEDSGSGTFSTGDLFNQIYLPTASTDVATNIGNTPRNSGWLRYQSNGDSVLDFTLEDDNGNSYDGSGGSIPLDTKIQADFEWLKGPASAPSDQWTVTEHGVNLGDSSTVISRSHDMSPVTNSSRYWQIAPRLFSNADKELTAKYHKLEVKA